MAGSEASESGREGPGELVVTDGVLEAVTWLSGADAAGIEPTGIVVACQSERSQLANRTLAEAMLRGRLAERAEAAREAELLRVRGEAVDASWGNQIRSYVLQPYQMIKDHRTKLEIGDVHRVLGGDLDALIKTYLMQKASGSLGTASAADED